MASLSGNPVICRGEIFPLTGNRYRSQRADTFGLFRSKDQVSRKFFPAAGEKVHFRGKTCAATGTETAEIVRPLPYFPPSVWGDTFDSFVWDHQAADKYAKEIEPLRKDVKDMLLAKTNGGKQKIHLIDIVERLGIFYHFEQEIDEQLEQIFNLISGSEEKNQYDLYDAALLFRILRQHGFVVSSGIFNKFIDRGGKFKEELSNDAKGLLSLYEAAFLRRHGEDILEEALAFTKGHLKRIAPQLSSALGKQVNHALVQPLHRGWERTEAYHNICFYEEDEHKNDKLLKFAKLDFNLLQMLHKQELSDLMRWWKPIIAKVEHARDRMVECYYSALGQYFEPQYSLARIMIAKVATVDTLIDDAFDAYGTLEELKIFTDAVQRWNAEEIDRLPEYMKLVYKTLLDIHQEFDVELRKRGRSFAVDDWKERTKEFLRESYKEAKWIMEGRIPNFEEYLEVGMITIGPFQMMPSFLFCVEAATRETFNLLKGNIKIVSEVAKIDRLIDDIATHEDDKARGQLTNGIRCYMEQYGVSEEEAITKFHEKAEDAWKDVNGEIRRTSKIPMIVFRMALNYARMMNIFYKDDGNHYTHVEKVLKPQIIFLLVNPLDP